MRKDTEVYHQYSNPHQEASGLGLHMKHNLILSACLQDSFQQCLLQKQERKGKKGKGRKRKLLRQCADSRLDTWGQTVLLSIEERE